MDPNGRGANEITRPHEEEISCKGEKPLICLKLGVRLTKMAKTGNQQVHNFLNVVKF